VLLAAAAWLTQLLNEERAKAGEPPTRHGDVLRAVRKVMEDLGVSAALNVEGCEYIGENGKTLPMIRFSDDVIFAVVAAVGGIGRMSHDNR
jgi:hypothetical protein